MTEIIQGAQQEEESSLIARILAGEKNLFHDLIRPYERRMYLTVFSILRDPAEAEDAVQETMLKAYRNLQSFRGESKFSSWLTSIALNEARGRLRKPGRAMTISIDEDKEGEDGHCHPFQLRDWREIPSEALERKDIAKLLETAVQELPEIYRTVFVLRDMEEASIEETARLLGLQTSAVKVRLHRARILLQNRLAPALQMALPAKKGIRAMLRRTR
ncbi:MAG TPA: sigma-70 family RNA polymerase sigma factor [Acidobacteriaceae bacterium]|nr:sigma-70 family RNA polymerase sigma factor [Acidobacteriaceae bacterium]